MSGYKLEFDYSLVAQKLNKYARQGVSVRAYWDKPSRGNKA